mgnify:CR=1 FL=1
MTYPEKKKKKKKELSKIAGKMRSFSNFIRVIKKATRTLNMSLEMNGLNN